ncbi:hypothetical protein HMPREF9445_00336 [Bacteroides clarus YIT 12056]|uniref:Uncharacterized protein n=1 Tax=Bacteroides clarus YIT 12056 TaxID=762984 RepID=A0ABN0CSA0_9BACE|nr:hypothetical protein HMPREF9445_00336 [Bacteroides clarus YIT 12056]
MRLSGKRKEVDARRHYGNPFQVCIQINTTGANGSIQMKNMNCIKHNLPDMYVKPNCIWKKTVM